MIIFKPLHSSSFGPTTICRPVIAIVPLYLTSQQSYPWTNWVPHRVLASKSWSVLYFFFFFSWSRFPMMTIHLFPPMIQLTIRYPWIKFDRSLQSLHLRRFKFEDMYCTGSWSQLQAVGKRDLYWLVWGIEEAIGLYSFVGRTCRCIAEREKAIWGWTRRDGRLGMNVFGGWLGRTFCVLLNWFDIFKLFILTNILKSFNTNFPLDRLDLNDFFDCLV